MQAGADPSERRAGATNKKKKKHLRTPSSPEPALPLSAEHSFPLKTTTSNPEQHLSQYPSTPLSSPHDPVLSLTHYLSLNTHAVQNAELLAAFVKPRVGLAVGKVRRLRLHPSLHPLHPSPAERRSCGALTQPFVWSLCRGGGCARVCVCVGGDGVVLCVCVCVGDPEVGCLWVVFFGPLLGHFAELNTPRLVI